MRSLRNLYPSPMLDMKSDKTSQRRIYLHAYDCLNNLCAEIQRGHYPTKADLSRFERRH
jgi:hypothetical protein